LNVLPWLASSQASDVSYGLTHGVTGDVSSALVGLGDGASFGLTATLTQALYPEADCEIRSNSGFYAGGQLLGGIGSTLATAGISGAGAGFSLAEDVDIEGANFAQNTASRIFSSGGTFAGRSIDDVSSALRSSDLSPEDVPIDVIVRDGNTLILNTRSAQALAGAGIARSAWNVIDRTGISDFESRLTDQLTRNGLDSTGVGSVRLTGGQ
jgi:hypothetical protein